MRYVKRQRMKIVRNLRSIPTFQSEDEERDWWSTHDLSPSLYEKLEKVVGPTGAVAYMLKEAKAKRAGHHE